MRPAPRSFGICCTAAIVFVAGVEVAHGATASITTDARGGQQILFEAAPGEANRLTVQFVDGAYVFRDTGTAVVIQAGTGCSAAGQATSCRATAPAALRVELGDANDGMQVTSVDPGFAGPAHAVNVLAGPGTDLVLGSPANDRLEGGPGPDRIDGRDGTDTAAYPRSSYPPELDDLQPQISDDGLANDGKRAEDDNVRRVEQIDTIDRTLVAANGPDTPLVATPIPNGPTTTDDSLVDTGGSGTVDAGDGDDMIDSTDQQPDTLLCGPGTDVALGDPGDQPVDCETFNAPDSTEPRLDRVMEVAPIRGDLLSFGFGDEGQLVPLREEVDLPLDSPVSATDGTVQITVAGTNGVDARTESAQLTGGSFTVDQTLLTPTPPLAAGALQRTARTVVNLARPDPTNCPRSLSQNKFDAIFSRTARGQLRVAGQFARATGRRNTAWRIRQTCQTTYVLIRRGSVVVRDLVKNSVVTLTKGQTYYARRGNR